MQDTRTITWQAPEYIQKEKSIDWFWAVGLAAILGAAAAFYFGNHVFAVFILISGGMFFLLAIRTPRDINYEINGEGIINGIEKYNFKTILGYDIQTDKYGPVLILHTDKKFMPIINFPIPEDQATDIENLLSQFIKKEEMPEPRTNKIIDIIGL